MSKLQVNTPGLKMAAAAAMVVSWVGMSAISSASAGETRTLSLYQVHTKETLTVTYKKNGRYIPSAMKKLNWILRDWRRDAVTKIDPKTIDLMWELHADLGSQKPVHIISAYRSNKTNAMLRRIGRRVARRSRHIKGQAIDMYFPDVPTSRVRGSALVRRVGGVGYYPRSGKHGFVHIDSGTVRHWPRVGKTRMAKILRNHRKTVGARRYKKQPSTLFASAKNKAPVPALAYAPAATKQASGPTSITPKALNKPVVAAVLPPPRPRSRPDEVKLIGLAALTDVNVTPVSATPEGKNYNTGVPRIRDMEMGEFITAKLTPAPEVHNQQSNASAKGSLTADTIDEPANSMVTMRPLLASVNPQLPEQTEESTSSWWSFLWPGSSNAEPSSEIAETDAADLRRMITTVSTAERIDVSALAPIQTTAISGKTDKLKVNRTGKGDLLTPVPVSMLKRKTSEAILKGTVTARLDERAEAILRRGDKPISFE